MKTEDTIIITLASDIHVGYGEKKPIRNKDSLITFEEVMKNAVKYESDCVLLAGDLYHENKPSREMQLEVIRILRKYCLSDKKCPLEFLSSAEENFDHSQFKTVNYLNPYMSISLPIFTIHGNHDDLSGTGLTALDMLHEAGYLNLFGKFKDIDNIIISPVIIKKGNTKVAIYGIGSQRDDRLHRAFENGSVIFKRPENNDTYFNILVLHQNRPRRNFSRRTGGYIPETLIPDFFNLVIWGHEHLSIPELELVERRSNDITHSFYILQPGSTIATSICGEEAGDKNCFILKINKKDFETKPIKLETVRQMMIDEIVLDVFPDRRKFAKSSVRPKNAPDEAIITKKVNEMLEILHNERLKKQPMLPLIRLKITYQDLFTSFPPINPKKFAAFFKDVVANPDDMFVIKVIKPKEEKPQVNIASKTFESFCDVSQVVEDYFVKAEEGVELEVISEKCIGESLNEYNTSEGTLESINKAFSESLKKQIDMLCNTIYGDGSNLPDHFDIMEMERKITDDINAAKRIRKKILKESTTQNIRL
uniref:Mre11_DNA_bind domain-containing protein n=1 Tax=Parastrongyloides trichosuri TaxID=131310 RepID=A0A0N4ZER5_PARTI